MTRCSYDGCENPAFQRSTGLCRSHVSQMQRNGKLKPIQKRNYTNRQSPDGLCTEPNCNEAAQSKGLCPKHLWARHPRRSPNGKRRKPVPISIQPSESAYTQQAKPVSPAPPSSEHEAEIRKLKAEIAQLQRLRQHDEKPKRGRESSSDSERTLMLESSLTALLDIVDSRAELKAELSRTEDEALRLADELLCQ